MTDMIRVSGINPKALGARLILCSAIGLSFSAGGLSLTAYAVQNDQTSNLTKNVLRFDDALFEIFVGLVSIGIGCEGRRLRVLSPSPVSAHPVSQPA